LYYEFLLIIYAALFPSLQSFAFEAQLRKFTPRGAFERQGVSTSAEVDQRFARPIGGLFLEKETQKLLILNNPV
jgi:hypothetical protein